ncbi:hypothetical protein D7X88_14060 [bacterium C-53]|nr:hypothetical protein [Lachnospiraceae bacterium]NBI04140.1 hypothetical protein [Lachnospiraceae bacterium]RKJ08613.1 hypothetical protein D7X88_14060 [bacterium C-53]
MKSKDVNILNKILNYCRQLDKACDMFDNDYNKFAGKSCSVERMVWNQGYFCTSVFKFGLSVSMGY